MQNRHRIDPARSVRGGRSDPAWVEWAAIATVLGYTAVGVRNIVRSARWKKRARTYFAERQPRSGASYFFLVVPALREQNVIEETLAYLRSLDYPDSRFEIIVAVDGKETGEHVTASVVEDYAKRHPDGAPVTVVTHRGPGQRRSLQLNAALEYIRRQIEEHGPRGRLLVGVYDADSRPEAETLAFIDDQASRNPQALAFQQTITYLENHRALVGRKIVHANAVYQSVWNYAFEIPRLLASRIRLMSGRPALFPPYCMGHGEFFDIRALDAVGGFPRVGPCDGIQIGFALSREGIAIHPVPFDDSCESPTSLRDIFRQHTYWYSGTVQYFRWYKPQPLRVDTVLPVICHTVQSLRWLCRPLVFAAATAAAQHRRGWRGAVAVPGAVFGYYWLGVTALRRTSNPATGAAASLGAGWIPAAVAFKSLGAANAVIRMFWGKSTFNKVER
ncbi:glycosyltransferase [Streptomyces sp. NPDC050658]|uniref:glycosyltransferase n=1 Tax=unclassified Streptomyces TaxID=2593676 RepID=UPI003427CDD9